MASSIHAHIQKTGIPIIFHQASKSQLFNLITIVLFALCCRPAPRNEDAMMVEIFEYIDRMFSIVRPRRLLYMAIDGVVGIFHLPQIKNPI